MAEQQETGTVANQGRLASVHATVAGHAISAWLHLSMVHRTSGSICVLCTAGVSVRSPGCCAARHVVAIYVSDASNIRTELPAYCHNTMMSQGPKQMLEM